MLFVLLMFLLLPFSVNVGPNHNIALSFVLNSVNKFLFSILICILLFTLGIIVSYFHWRMFSAVFVLLFPFINLFFYLFLLLLAVVVTAVTEVGSGKPKFFSTPELIAFCRKWRLPTNHVWLFSTRWASVFHHISFVHRGILMHN